VTDTVTVTRDDPHIGVITLNRPERLNAITRELVRDLHQAIDDVSAERTLRAVVLTGAGRGFCAGFDLKSDLADESADQERDTQGLYAEQQLWGAMVTHLRAIPVPVIAAVNGPAAGGGFALALAADMRVASTAAKFLVANVKIGLTGGEMGMTYFLPRLVGTGRAAELILTGRTVDAVEAERWGMVNRLVEPDQLMASAFELARQVTVLSPFAIRLTKEMLHLGPDSPGLAHTVILENRSQSLAGAGGDTAEAVAAFRDRREPDFGNR
jgi:enoyl-CoA hydratase